jgi:probable phosphoglycerate mutase
MNETFLFARHGATPENLRGLRCGGDLDEFLAEEGCRQSLELAIGLRRQEYPVDLILTGPLRRTRQTALIVSGTLGDIPIEISPWLVERRLGAWNCHPIAENEEMLISGVTPPGGESSADFTSRIEHALAAVRERSGQRLLVIGSKGIGRVFNQLLGGKRRLVLENAQFVQLPFLPPATNKAA